MQTLEQAKREAYQDQAAEEWEFALSELTQLVRRWGKATIAKELSKIPEIDVDMRKDWVPSCDEIFIVLELFCINGLIGSCGV